MGAYTAFSGQLREGARQMHSALGVIEAKGDAVSAAMVANFLSGAYARLGDFASAEEIIEHSNRYAEKGDAIAIVDRDIAVAGYSLEHGDPAQARQSALECSIRAEDLGAYACVLASNVITGGASLATDDATYGTVHALALRLGKTPVEVNDAPGFVSNRVLMPLINEAACAVMEGVATSEAIDQVRVDAVGVQSPGHQIAGTHPGPSRPLAE